MCYFRRRLVRDFVAKVMKISPIRDLYTLLSNAMVDPNTKFKPNKNHHHYINISDEASLKYYRRCTTITITTITITCCYLSTRIMINIELQSCMRPTPPERSSDESCIRVIIVFIAFDKTLLNQYMSLDSPDETPISSPVGDYTT